MGEERACLQDLAFECRRRVGLGRKPPMRFDVLGVLGGLQVLLHDRVDARAVRQRHDEAGMSPAPQRAAHQDDFASSAVASSRILRRGVPRICWSDGRARQAVICSLSVAFARWK